MKWEGGQIDPLHQKNLPLKRPALRRANFKSMIQLYIRKHNASLKSYVFNISLIRLSVSEKRLKNFTSFNK